MNNKLPIFGLIISEENEKLKEVIENYFLPNVFNIIGEHLSKKKLNFEGEPIDDFAIQKEIKYYPDKYTKEPLIEYKINALFDQRDFKDMREEIIEGNRRGHFMIDCVVEIHDFMNLLFDDILELPHEKFSVYGELWISQVKLVGDVVFTEDQIQLIKSEESLKIIFNQKS